MEADSQFVPVRDMGTDSLSIWWIDDCFTNISLPDYGRTGYLPISKIRRGVISCDPENPSTDYYDSGAAYAALCSISKEKGISFFCSSFEYARDHWADINVKKALLLVDIGYEGFDKTIWDNGKYNAGTFGIDFVHDMLNRKPAEALIVYLTYNPNLISNWMKDNKTWIPGGSYPIRKYDPETSEAPTVILKALVEYFISRQHQKASDWTAKEYQEVRRNIYNYCKKQGNEWLAHHWPGGSEEAGTYLEHVIPIAGLCKLPNGFPLNSPHFEWGEAQKPLIYSFDRPPIRALATFDRSNDFLFCLKTFQYEFESELNGVFRLKMDCPDAFTEGCLWFNASALCLGILKIGQGFKGIVRGEMAEGGGLFTLKIDEQAKEKTIQLTLTIEQRLVGSNNEERSYPLPNIQSVEDKNDSNKIRDAYEYFRKSGFELHIENGDLLIKIAGEKEDGVIWQTLL